MAYTDWSVVTGETPSASKWNQLGENDAGFKDGTNIDAGAITPEKLLAGTDSDWEWKTWTPSWSNLTVGNAVQKFRYKQVGKLVYFKGFITLGSTSAVGTNLSFSLPVNCANIPKGTASGGAGVMGQAYFEDNGSTNAVGLISYNNATTATLFVLNASSTYLSTNAITSSIPFAWGNGDEMRFQGFYEAA